MPRRPRVWEGMSSDALHPAVPALTWVPPLSPPGLVAAWPDSPGLLPPPCLLPTPGQGATLPEGYCACPGEDSHKPPGLRTAPGSTLATTRPQATRLSHKPLLRVLEEETGGAASPLSVARLAMAIRGPAALSAALSLH